MVRFYPDAQDRSHRIERIGKLDRDLQKQPVAPQVGTLVGTPLGSMDGSCTKVLVKVVNDASQAPTWPDDLEASGKADVSEVTWTPSADVVFKS
ncbi:hypothetical protein B296_00018876 [Ensete ventricosum]|uniref:Uncharacterized protein n=1 Tax=Ensete ventricosum TaxID=4639 RepID=A0A427A2H2_ENSVE|nr:hypothetical protein B296_00018876 [Ensete ventricosum]